MIACLSWIPLTCQLANEPAITDQSTAFCEVYGHYTHHCPHLARARQLWDEAKKREAANASQGQAGTTRLALINPRVRHMIDSKRVLCK